VQLRAASVEDAAAIADIHVSAWRAAYRGVVPDEHLQNLSLEKRQLYWSSAIANGEPVVRVAVEPNGIVGWIAFSRCRDRDGSPESGEIWAMYVSPSSWARGIGRQLLAQACSELQHLGFKCVSLWVLLKNERACRFYSKAGFAPEPASVKQVDIGGASLEEVRYVRQLAS
jgi:GNAT superfamily N-acetyltransferase